MARCTRSFISNVAILGASAALAPAAAADRARVGWAAGAALVASASRQA
jgi:hypothetical protein